MFEIIKCNSLALAFLETGKAGEGRDLQVAGIPLWPLSCGLPCGLPVGSAAREEMHSAQAAGFPVHGTVFHIKQQDLGLPGGPVVKNPPSNAGDSGLIPGEERRCHMPRGN